MPFLHHKGAGQTHLDEVEVTVLDEADHMADLGFLPTVRRRHWNRPRAARQRLLFSATLDTGVDVLVRQFLTAPGPTASTPPLGVTRSVGRLPDMPGA